MAIDRIKEHFEETPMKNEAISRIIIRHSLCWALAFITPPIVMVVLDSFDRHTPTSVAVYSSIALMFVFILSHSILVSQLQGQVDGGKES